MTKLTKPVYRVTAKRVSGRNVIVGLGPLGGQPDALISVRLQGTQKEYTVLLSDLYRVAAQWHGQAEARAKKEARKYGVPWKRAYREFMRGRSFRQQVAESCSADDRRQETAPLSDRPAEEPVPAC